MIVSESSNDQKKERKGFLMKFQINSRYTSNTIFEDEATSFSALVEAAVKAKVNLNYANLHNADLRNADLRNANLNYANLIGANLNYANLNYANLNYANLHNADLIGANLRNANLRNANLHNANLIGANLIGADLKYYPIQVLGHKHFLQTTNDGRLSIGCNTYTFTEWKRHAAKIGELQGYSSSDIKIYKLHISHIEKISKLIWKVK